MIIVDRQYRSTLFLFCMRLFHTERGKPHTEEKGLGRRPAHEISVRPDMLALPAYLALNPREDADDVYPMV
jgi:hypothetical protein